MGSTEVVGLRKAGEEMEGIHGAVAIWSSLLLPSLLLLRETGRESPSGPCVRAFVFLVIPEKEHGQAMSTVKRLGLPKSFFLIILERKLKKVFLFFFGREKNVFSFGKIDSHV